MEKQKTDTKNTNKQAKRKEFRNFMYCSNDGKLPAWATNNTTIKAHLDYVLPKGTKYAFIWHDRDLYTQQQEKANPAHLAGSKRPKHLHISINLSSARPVSTVANYFGVEKNFIEIIRDTTKHKNAKSNLFGYLCHMTPTAKSEGKVEYSTDEVVANFDYKSFVNGTLHSIESNRIDRNSLIEKILTGKLTKYDFIIDDRLSHFYCSSSKNKTLVETCCDMRSKKLMNTNNEGKSVKVVYVQGTAGSGKTTWAKRYAEKHNLSYYVSSTSNDPLQDYSGQRCVIFDDTRPSDFNASDWLKMLDPYNNQTSCHSRFYNKYLAVDLIILTNTTDWDYFFKFCKNKGGEKEPMEQFYRRFQVVAKCYNPFHEDGKLKANVNIFKVIKTDEPREIEIETGAKNKLDGTPEVQTWRTNYALSALGSQQFVITDNPNNDVLLSDYLI